MDEHKQLGDPSLLIHCQENNLINYTNIFLIIVHASSVINSEITGTPTYFSKVRSGNG